MKLLLVIGIGLLLAGVALYAQNASSTSVPGRVSAKPNGNPYAGLRETALAVTREQLGLPKPEHPESPWGVVMEIGMDQATVSIVAFAEGSASIYFSTGGGYIGGGQHPPIHAAALALVKAGAPRSSEFKRVSEASRPVGGQVCFHLRTDAGLYSAKAAESELQAGRHPLSKLYAAGQDLITQYRLWDQKAQGR